jgi:uncharacterized protein (TIGR03437 family)
MNRLILFFATLSLAFAQQPEWDTTGNGLLNGVYNFREALWVTNETASSNVLFEATSQFGTITFDGRGNYSASFADHTGARFNTQGTYAIAASGLGFIRRSKADGDIVYGGVSNGVFIGSNTESGFNDLFIAARQNASVGFSGRYNVAYMNLSTANLAQIRDAEYQLAPNGAGSLGSFSVRGYTGGDRNAVTQSVSNAGYSISNGVGTLTFGASSSAAILSGTQQLFLSPDGQFIFGGSTTGWDMFVGVRAPAAAPMYEGLFYQAGMDVRRTALPNGLASLNSYFGAFNVIGSLREMIGHQRLQTSPDAAYEYTYSDYYQLASDGSHDDFLGQLNFVSADGNYRIGYGTVDYLGLNVAIKLAPFTGSGVFLNPTGVVNAASYTPFTTGIAPGQLITLFGTGLAGGNFSDSTFPPTLGTVTVRINGRIAPVYDVRPGQISALVPYETAVGVAEIQVTRGAQTSNRVTAYVNRTAPGVFATDASGLGHAAALHADYSLITTQNPARAGEVILIYATGLGATTPAVATGAAGPTNPLAETALPSVSIGGRTGRVLFSGLAPSFRGLYQMNVEVPAGVPGGDQFIDIDTPDTTSSQITLPMSGARSAGAQVRDGRAAHASSSPSSLPRTRRGSGATNSSPSSDR